MIFRGDLKIVLVKKRGGEKPQVTVHDRLDSRAKEEIEDKNKVKYDSRAKEEIEDRNKVK